MMNYLNLIQGFECLEVEGVVHDTVVDDVAVVDDQGGRSILTPIGQAENQAGGEIVHVVEQILGDGENPSVATQLSVQVRHHFPNLMVSGSTFFLNT